MKNQEVIYSNSYEQRTSVINGNQTQTYYTYDSVMRRMTNLKTRNPNGDLLKLEYTYDSVGNITSITNTGLNPYTQTYTYDDVYQLDSAYGNWTDNYTPITYSLNMTYSPAGRIINKGLRGKRADNNGTYILDYNNTYSYNFPNNPYAVNRITNSLNGQRESFSWDVKGNMISHKSDLNSWKERFLCWTEDNRLQAVKDYSMGAYYNYDAAGERNLKLTGGIINVTQNGQSVYAPVFDQQTLYASALVTVNDKGYTKHYFEEGKRICSKIGSGELKNVFDPVPKIEKSYEEQRDIQVDGINTTYSQCMDISPFIKNRNLYETIITKYTNQINSSEPAFYYHSDHLGSASYITDSSGIQTQQLVYLPFGEDWVDKKYNVSQFQTPYKFNGKEKDPETGNNYYGARYYWGDGNIFLSVDPMSDKYPHLSSYAYCANNPVMLIDPNGMEIESNRDDNYEGNKSLAKNLSKKTGLNLTFKDRKLQYEKDENGNAVINGGSKSARNDLIKAIDDETKTELQFTEGNTRINGGLGDKTLGIIGLDFSDFSQDDNETFDIGMVFMHELGHTYFGDEDPKNSDIRQTDFNSKIPGFYTKGNVGGAVERVNRYRKELNLPLRESYKSNPNMNNTIPFKHSNGNVIWLKSFKK